ncbi:MAG TPA: T9SS type A sorting domain-containing protein [Bacteroidales bacterium]|nr:T9SS type A sorting domain-containing protein [Bacteroidales bacterium]HPT03378.1 T9SS type A sorting domain-containing protein [Bacteroidales bacterium]
MKTLKSIILMILIPFSVSAQDFMTVRDIFNFEIGDEFHIEGRGLNQPPNADRITITCKYYSPDSNTVYYVRDHDSYYVTIENYETHYHFWTKTDTVSYSNLELPVNQSEYWITYDTAMVIYDTINAIFGDYCQKLINGYYYAWNPFEPVYYSSLYGEGLGLVRSYYYEPAGSTMYDNVLFYYKKNGVCCGIPDTTTLSVPENHFLKGFNIYPIPAKSYLIIENKRNLEIQSITLFDLNGNIIRQFDLNSSHLDVPDLASGFYILKVSSKSGVLMKKIVIE